MNVMRRSIRSTLTLSGIAIGICMILLLVSMTKGIESSMFEVLGKLQNVIVIKKGAIIFEWLGEKWVKGIFIIWLVVFMTLLPTSPIRKLRYALPTSTHLKLLEKKINKWRLLKRIVASKWEGIAAPAGKDRWPGNHPDGPRPAD
jgi:hypothetical protein